METGERTVKTVSYASAGKRDNRQKNVLVFERTTEAQFREHERLFGRWFEGRREPLSKIEVREFSLERSGGVFLFLGSIRR